MPSNSADSSNSAEHRDLHDLIEQAWDIRRSFPQEALEMSYRAREMAEDLPDEKAKALALRNIGTAYYLLSLYDDSLDFLEKSLVALRSLEDRKAEAEVIRTIGNVYHSIEQNDTALDQYRKALAITEEIEDRKGRAYTNGNIGYVLQKLNRYPEALEHMLKTERECLEMKDDLGLCDVRSNIGRIYLKTEDLTTARKYLDQALANARSISHLRGMAHVSSGLGQLSLKEGNPQEALAAFKQALRYAEEMGEKQLIYSIEESISEVYESLDDTAQALKHHKRFAKLKGEIMQRSQKMALASVRTRFEVEQSQREQALLESRNTALSKANAVIRTKNKDITDSLIYASRLQRSILPRLSELAKAFDGHFVIWKPKDIVSGDFYWFDNVANVSMIALADCTGHGVPGAFMSLLGIESMRQIVRNKDINHPHLALEALDRKIGSTFANADHIRDGMDMALLVYHHETRLVQFAGAKLPLFRVGRDGAELTKGSRYAIGGGWNTEKHFETIEFIANPGDMFYLFSDGLADQFGGPKGKKFQRKRLLRLLEEYHKHPLAEQKEQVQESHREWKGELEQVDDVSLLGFRIPD